MQTFQAAVFRVGTTAPMAMGAFHHAGAQTFRRLGGWSDIVELDGPRLLLRSSPGAADPYAIEVRRQDVKRIWKEPGLLAHKLHIEAGTRYALGFRKKTALHAVADALASEWAIAISMP